MTTFIFLLLPAFPTLILSLTIKDYTKLPLPPPVTSPDSLTFNSLGGGPYAGVSDGRVLYYDNLAKKFLNFGYTNPNRTSAFCDGTSDVNKSPTCGFPSGLSTDLVTGKIYACDPYTGLAVLEPFGGLAKILVPTINGVPYKFLVAVDYAANKRVYFTNASSKYGPQEVNKSIATKDSTAQLLEYNPATKQLQVLLNGLSGAVGVATDPQAQFVLVSEALANRVRKFYLTGEKAGTSEILVTFSGNPNKIKRNQEGNYWVTVDDQNNSNTFSPKGVKIDSNGNILATVDLSKEYNTRLNTVAENFGKLYIGGIGLASVGRYTIEYD